VVRVRFGDTDLMAIAHHAAYLSYFEAGRVEYMHRRGIRYHDWVRLGVHLPVVEAGVRYRRSARFDDRLVIETRLARMTRVTLRFDYRVLRDGAQPEELVAEGHTLLACVDDAHVPRRIPPDAAALLVGGETHPRPIDQV
jgi:acyl-CoA thioester hydrolase